jgi:hypothetical protein
LIRINTVTEGTSKKIVKHFILLKIHIQVSFVIMYGFDHKNSENLFFRRITTIRSTGNLSQQFKYADKNYVNQMKPLLIALKYTGLLPIAISKSGKFNVRY